jgi:uncharacterized integral membrane protein (TIGR00697 family)
MQTSSDSPISQSNLLSLQPRFLWFFILSFSMAIALVNWFDARMIRLFFVDTDAGALVFPLTFLLSDLMTEVYGYKRTRLAIWCGLFFNFFYIGYGYLITLFPSPAYSIAHNAAFDAMMVLNTRVIIASTLTYLISEPLNSYIMAKLKIKMRGKHMGFRFFTASFISSGVDSALFGALAFSGIMNVKELLLLILTMWFIKVATEFLGIPLSVYLAKRLKKAEHLDIYDRNTRFGIFSLDTTYTSSDNEFALKSQHP